MLVIIRGYNTIKSHSTSIFLLVFLWFSYGFPQSNLPAISRQLASGGSSKLFEMISCSRSMLWAQETTGWPRGVTAGSLRSWLTWPMNQCSQHVTVYYMWVSCQCPQLHRMKWMKMVCLNLFKWDKSKACKSTTSKEVVAPFSNWLWHSGGSGVSSAHFVKR